MYAGWTRTRLAARVRETGQGSAVWKAGYAAPESAAWHSTLSPVLASLDLFDADYLVSRPVTTDLYLINDSWHDANIHVDLLLTRECPELIPEAACFDRPIQKWSFDFATKADSLQKVPVIWKVPEEEGSYWLTARMTGVPGRPVLSQRFVRAIKPPVVTDEAKQRTFLVLGNNKAGRAFFSSRGLRTSNQLDLVSPATDVVVVWNASQLTDSEKRCGKALCDFATRGGRVIVLATPAWDWPELCEVKIGKGSRFSRVFTKKAATAPWLSGIDPAWLVRWNGFPGTVGVAPLEGPVMAKAEELLWAREPNTAVAAVLPAAQGSGRILFAQLDLQRHVDRSAPNYDPAAERLLLNLLTDGK